MKGCAFDLLLALLLALFVLAMIALPFLHLL